MSEPQAKMLTEICRDTLTKQPDQMTFILPRLWLETLVRDSENYGEANAKAVRELLAEQAEYPDPKSLDDQVADVAARWPGSVMHNTDQGQLLEIPGIKLPPGYNASSATIFVQVPHGYPHSCPMRFWTRPGVRYAHGGTPGWTSDTTKIFGGEYVQWYWRVQAWNPHHCTLRTYVHAMSRAFWVIKERDNA